MCRPLSVSRSGYYKWSNHPKSDRDKQDAILTKLIKEPVHLNHCQHYPGTLHQSQVVYAGCTSNPHIIVFVGTSLRAPPQRGLPDADHPCAAGPCTCHLCCTAWRTGLFATHDPCAFDGPDRIRSSGLTTAQVALGSPAPASVVSVVGSQKAEAMAARPGHERAAAHGRRGPERRRSRSSAAC